MPKSRKRAPWWDDLSLVVLPNGVQKAECKYCKILLSYRKGGPTSHLSRHLEKCTKRYIYERKQRKINFMSADCNGEGCSSTIIPPLQDGKLDMLRMREVAAHWIFMHEQPFSILEEEGYNLMMKRARPEWTKISRNTGKTDYVKVYEQEKKKLKTVLNQVGKICLTTDLWQSSPQKMGYMVVTGHFVDLNWKMQKRVLNFFHLPPSSKVQQLSNPIYRCLQDWSIANKIVMISVDNASTNDSCIRNLRETFSRTKRLICDGKVFHVRCCPHILNIMVQFGLKSITYIIEKVHDSVEYIRASEQGQVLFAEKVKQTQLSYRKLILENKTRWNSTYEMLATTLKFKDVFPLYAEEDPFYNSYPSVDEWKRVEKVCEVLKVFKSVTNIISGSDYPTSNLFLMEVYRIKLVLDKYKNDPGEWMKALIKNMKQIFDKYWGEYNLLMALGVILDPRYKLRGVEYVFGKMYKDKPAKAREYISEIKETLYSLYLELLLNLKHLVTVQMRKIQEVVLLAVVLQATILTMNLDVMMSLIIRDPLLIV
ncbi:zinc finger BED domain-containing protein RICESLEEPER 1-like [Silene latifolia]|uniref:zinc finger BED domain-containing protein RICESLEEPER 1-like n=1 Tax=Silene latifolia TaxID=37657 RepID=UPI003D776E1F